MRFLILSYVLSVNVQIKFFCGLKKKYLFFVIHSGFCQSQWGWTVVDPVSFGYETQHTQKHSFLSHVVYQLHATWLDTVRFNQHFLQVLDVIRCGSAGRPGIVGMTHWAGATGTEPGSSLLTLSVFMRMCVCVCARGFVYAHTRMWKSLHWSVRRKKDSNSLFVCRVYHHVHIFNK